jgi:glycosyltransferase involved in cell wall biosynthesis
MSNQIRPLLSLVVPAYNEANRLPATLERIREHRRSWNFRNEVIVVIEPSDDGTLALAEEAAKCNSYLVVLTHHEKRGKGFAVRNGMLHARGDCIFFTDADLKGFGGALRTRYSAGSGWMDFRLTSRFSYWPRQWDFPSAKCRFTGQIRPHHAFEFCKTALRCSQIFFVFAGWLIKHCMTIRIRDREPQI